MAMSTFSSTLNPTPFGFFDSDTVFQTEADAMVTFVKRKLGDDVLSVELTRKQIWACFEEATLEYSYLINQNQLKSQLSNLMGTPTGSLEGAESKYSRETLEFLLRKAEPYSVEAGLGGLYTSLSGSIDLEEDRQDYDLMTELKDESGVALFDNPANVPKTKLKIQEVMHFSPQAAYRFFDTTSAINYLNNEFSFESFTPETVFYVLPVFEDVLRGGMLKLSSKVRRSNFSYRITGTKLRIFPVPTSDRPSKLFIRVGYAPDPLNPGFGDETINGVNGPSNAQYGNLKYSSINSIGHQWIRQFSLALAKELLGLIRSKFGTVPIPGGDLTLNGDALVSQGREDKQNLRDKLVEMLNELTYTKMLENQALESENVTKILKAIPIPMGKAIIVG
jgi:hypothetical protein